MSIIPYRTSRPRERRRPLDQAQVVRAALALLDEAGIEEITMRRVAERLGVKAASLYRHVRDKDELLVLLGDEISGEIPLQTLSGTWRERLVEMVWRVRRGLLAHRHAARVLGRHTALWPAEAAARRGPVANPAFGGAERAGCRARRIPLQQLRHRVRG